MKHATIHLLYFKQGDNLAGHLKSTANVAEALEAHAAQMDAAADRLRAIKGIVGEEPVTIHAGTLFIDITAADAIVERLVAAGLAEIEESEEDDLIE